MTLTSSVKRIAMATAAAAAMVWFGAATPAEAQYYGHPGYGYAPPTYVHPKILRKQREMEMRVIRKYGYQAPAYRQPRGYGYGYGGPVYQQPRGYGYDSPIYRHQPYDPRRGEPAYPLPGYGNQAPAYRRPLYDPN